jgi:hypothetical protein
MGKDSLGSSCRFFLTIVVLQFSLQGFWGCGRSALSGDVLDDDSTAFDPDMVEEVILDPRADEMVHVDGSDDEPAVEDDACEMADADEEEAPYRVAWSRTFGGPDFDEGVAVLEADEGGYVVLGSTHSFGAGEEDAWLLRLDEMGEVLWEKAFGRERRDTGALILKTGDGGYMMALSSFTWETHYDAVVLKLDAGGEIQWQKAYGREGKNFDWVNLVEASSDGGYYLAGFIELPYDHLWLFKIDESGNMLWQNAYTRPCGGGVQVLRETAGGGLIAAGTSACYLDGGYYWVIELDGGGNIIRQDVEYIDSSVDSPCMLQAFPGGGYILATSYHAADMNLDFWVARVDESGRPLWQKNFDLENLDDPFQVLAAPDGSLLVSGSTRNLPDGRYGGWIISLDDAGNSAWQKTYRAGEVQEVTSVAPTADGGLVFTGWLRIDEERYDLWVVKTEASGAMPESCHPGLGSESSAAAGSTSAMSPVEETFTRLDVDALSWEGNLVVTETTASTDMQCGP